MRILSLLKPSSSFLLGVVTMVMVPESYYLRMNYYYHDIFEEEQFDPEGGNRRMGD